jgi:hypothetical protein
MWRDPPLRDAFLKEVLIDLRDEVWRLKKDKDELQGALAVADAVPQHRRADMGSEFEALVAELGMLAESNAKKEAELVQYRARGRCNFIMSLLACLIALAVACAMVQ